MTTPSKENLFEARTLLNTWVENGEGHRDILGDDKSLEIAIATLLDQKNERIQELDEKQAFYKASWENAQERVKVLREALQQIRDRHDDCEDDFQHDVFKIADSTLTATEEDA